MTFTELFISIVPTLVIAISGIWLVNKSGVFEQRAHRKRVEALLERIAQAVENNKP